MSRLLILAALIAMGTLALINSPRWIGITAPETITLKGFVSDGFARRPAR